MENSKKYKKNNKEIKSEEDELENGFIDEYENLSDDEDIDLSNLTSNKLQKNSSLNTVGKKLYVVLEHA
jgi:hypothetical protein